MKNACTNLTEVVRSTRLLKIDGYSLLGDISYDYCFKCRWHVDGYEWEIRIYPKPAHSFVSLRVIFLSEARAGSVKTILRCCLVDPRGMIKPTKEERLPVTFRKPQDNTGEVVLIERRHLAAAGYLNDDSLTVQCTLEVLNELPDIATASLKQLPLSSSNLHQHLAELLQSETGADVTFLVSGESFAAHKLMVAARSPVFMAQFFGDMKEKCLQHVEIEDMEAPVFKALLRFMYTDTVPEFGHHGEVDVEAIYTDTVPEFEQQEEADAEAVTVMAQHLLAAADRYGMDRLKLICAGELSGGINVDTVATTLALAEQHNCPELKEKCIFLTERAVQTAVSFIVGVIKCVQRRCTKEEKKRLSQPKTVVQQKAPNPAPWVFVARQQLLACLLTSIGSPPVGEVY